MRFLLGKEGKERLASGILSTEPVAGLTHNFYRYPARFSPDFVRAMLGEFTQKGDVVYDPFMGGGTTLVEAAAMGRHSIGTDISSLATFISRAKTTSLSDSQLANVETWLKLVAPALNVSTAVPPVEEWIRRDYQRNINDQDTWRIRKLLEIGLNYLDVLDTRAEKRLARCILLKTGQWAFDCRSQIPSAAAFQKQILVHGQEMIDAAHDFASVVGKYTPRPKVMCIHRSAAGIEDERKMEILDPPKLVLTSPPYPGLHVLYHRWQVRGRKETAAPFWIAGTLDGDGASFYTFGDRKKLEKYFSNVRSTFRSIATIALRKTAIVQMVAFSEPTWQLPLYLEAMAEAGFEERKLFLSQNDVEGRTWRSVPSRRWYASQMGATGGSQEVVLFHQKR
jgi:hypothetical protein